MKELNEEIRKTTETIEQLDRAFDEEKMKYGMPSTARRDEHRQKVRALENYIKGLIAAKNFIEKEGK